MRAVIRVELDLHRSGLRRKYEHPSHYTLDSERAYESARAEGLESSLDRRDTRAFSCCIGFVWVKGLQASYAVGKSHGNLVRAIGRIEVAH